MAKIQQENLRFFKKLSNIDSFDFESYLGGIREIV